MTGHAELQKAAEYAAQDVANFADEDEESRALQQFHEEVSPEKVLALIAENKRLRTDYAGLASFNPEWDRVAAAQDSVREHMEMVTQLRAEVAGLKTGYEAYERVNAELKAEVEALRQSVADHKQCIASDNELFREVNLECNRYHSVIVAVGELLGISKEEQDEEEATQEELIEAINELLGQIHGMQGDLDEYKSEHESLRKDADRYQWLKINSSVMLKKTASYTTDLGLINTIYPAASELDLCLDAAMGNGEQS